MNESEEISIRLDHARKVAREAAALALNYFRDIHELKIESKGTQDPVSNADREVELFVRQQLLAAFTEDGIIGEEHAPVTSKSGYTWVIDPIDGTANFIVGSPGWAVVIACVQAGHTVAGVIHDPVADEHFCTRLGHGAQLNDKPLRVADSTSLSDGILAVGHSSRVPVSNTIRALTEIMNAGGIFYRNGSGALMLAYVAAGRLIGYCEPHMNCWDCIAGMLMITEAGGRIDPYDSEAMLQQGHEVVAACPGIYPELQAICARSFNNELD